MALGNGYITQALPFAGGIYTRAFLTFHGFEHLYFGASVPISMSKHVWEDVQTIGVGTCVCLKCQDFHDCSVVNASVFALGGIYLEICVCVFRFM